MSSFIGHIEWLKRASLGMMTTEDKPVGQSPDEAPEPSIEQKYSRAKMIWFLVVVVVLGVLWFETRNTATRHYNCFLNGDSSSIGAEVYVDGKKMGTMVESGNSGLGGGTFWLHVNDGPHTIEIKKPGFKVFQKAITMRQEDYVAVDLHPSN